MWWVSHNKHGAFAALAILGLLLGLPAVSVSAADSLSDEQPAIDSLVAQVQAALAALEADPDIDETAKFSSREEYERALGRLRQAADYAAEADRYREAIRSGPERIATLIARVQAIEATDPLGELQLEAGNAALRRELESRRLRLATLQDEGSAVAGELARMERRPVEIVERISQVELSLSEIRPRLPVPDRGDGDDSDEPSAETLLLRAEEASLTQELRMLQQEQRSQAVRQELLLAQRESLERETAAAEAVVQRLEQLLSERLADTAGRVRQAADAVPDPLLRRSPSAAALADEARSLADELEAVLADTSGVELAREDLASRSESLAEEFESVREQMALGLGGRTMVQVLFDLDRRCIDAPDAVRAMSVPMVEGTRLAALQVRDRLIDQVELQQQLLSEPDESLTELLEARREVLGELGRQYGSLVRELAGLEQVKESYLAQAGEIRRFISRQLFGFGLKSAPVLSLETVRDLPRAVAWAFRAEHGRELAAGLLSVGTRMPVRTFSVALLVILLLAFRPRMLAALERAAGLVRRVSTDGYRHTAKVLLVTVLLALPLPLVIGYLGQALTSGPRLSDWMWGVTAGLWRGAWILFAFAFVATVLRRDGLGIAHFGWNKGSAARLRRAILHGSAVYLPAFLLTLSCSFRDASRYFDSLGRVSFLVAHVWMAFVLYRLLFADSGLDFGSEDRGALLARWRPAWSALLVAAPLTLVVLMILGYLITTIMLSQGLIASLGLVASGALLHGLTLRWFSIRQRRLALSEALERRRAHAEISREQDSPSPSADGAIVVSEEQIELDVVESQIQRLLRALFGLGTFVAVLAFWSSSFPLVELIDSVRVPWLGGLSLLQLVTTLLIAVGTYVIVRNLPGLLELALLRTTEITPGTRHAIYTLCQYGVAATGIALAFNVIQVDWAKFGWIAAALSVGLGFGLQEVVANFVCGLILLFERPIRVGDIVTIEGTTGRVTRIQMRATTITNWDRQELVVPNKTLITNTLLNWTLTEPLNRVVIPVGVAYGSDTDHARRILLEVAADNPRILEEPEPVATFEQFGDSSLNLVLRGYLPDLERRLETITELHAEIHRRFAAAGIQIPFPQRDVHLRDGSLDTRDTGTSGDSPPE